MQAEVSLAHGENLNVKFLAPKLKPWKPPAGVEPQPWQ